MNKREFAFVFFPLDSLNSEYFEFIEEQSEVEYDIRLCDHKVDLYVLQPDKLNSSGQNNPLKGKLTNCHYTGCERYIIGTLLFESNL